MSALGNDEQTPWRWLGSSLGQMLSIIQGRERSLWRIIIIQALTPRVHLLSDRYSPQNAPTNPNITVPKGHAQPENVLGGL